MLHGVQCSIACNDKLLIDISEQTFQMAEKIQTSKTQNIILLP